MVANRLLTGKPTLSPTPRLRALAPRRVHTPNTVKSRSTRPAPGPSPDARPFRPGRTVARHPAFAGRIARAAARIRARLVRQSGLSAADPPRRRALRGNTARNGGHRRLADASSRRHQVFRKAGAAILAHRRRLRRLRHPAMDGASLARAGGLSRRAVHRLHRSAPRRPAPRPVQRGGARRLRLVCAERAHPDPRCGTDVLDERRHGRTAARAARRRDCARGTRLDARRLVGAGAGGPVEGTDRRRAPRCVAGRLFAAHARLGGVAAAASCCRPAAVCSHCRAVVHRGVARQSRVLSFFFHPRAFRAFSH